MQLEPAELGRPPLEPCLELDPWLEALSHSHLAQQQAAPQLAQAVPRRTAAPQAQRHDLEVQLERQEVAAAASLRLRPPVAQ